jgi:hypothetical protein
MVCVLIVGVDEGREGIELQAIIRVVHLIELRELLSTSLGVGLRALCKGLWLFKVETSS